MLYSHSATATHGSRSLLVAYVSKHLGWDRGIRVGPSLKVDGLHRLVFAKGDLLDRFEVLQLVVVEDHLKVRTGEALLHLRKVALHKSLLVHGVFLNALSKGVPELLRAVVLHSHVHPTKRATHRAITICVALGDVFNPQQLEDVIHVSVLNADEPILPRRNHTLKEGVGVVLTVVNADCCGIVVVVAIEVVSARTLPEGTIQTKNLPIRVLLLEFLHATLDVALKIVCQFNPLVKITTLVVIVGHLKPLTDRRDLVWEFPFE